MNTLMALNDWIVSATDWIFGWILWLPRDLGLLALAFLTSSMLALSRKWLTDQDWLHRAEADHKVLSRLMREAKKSRDKAAVQRYKATSLQLKMLSMRQEWHALLGALLPVALLGTWAFARMAYVPPAVGDTVEIRMFLSNVAIGDVAHLVPAPGLKVEDGRWVQAVVADQPVAPVGLWDVCNRRVMDFFGLRQTPEAVALWKVRLESPQQLRLSLRYAGRTYPLDFVCGTRKYAAPVARYPETPVQAIAVALKPVKLFGVVGGLDVIALQPWLLGYLVLAIALMGVTKRIYHVA